MYIYSFSSRQWKTFDEVCFCVCQNVENSGMFTKDFIQHRYYESLFTVLFLRSLWLTTGKCYKGIMSKVFLADLKMSKPVDA